MHNDRLKNLRIKSGYTQQEVADKIGVTKSTISKYEKGQRGLNHIEELATLFGVEPAYILFGKTLEEMNTEISNQVHQAENEERNFWESILLPGRMSELLPLFEKLNDVGQQKAVERIKELAEIPRYQRKPEEGGSGAVDPQENE